MALGFLFGKKPKIMSVDDTIKPEDLRTRIKNGLVTRIGRAHEGIHIIRQYGSRDLYTIAKVDNDNYKVLRKIPSKSRENIGNVYVGKPYSSHQEAHNFAYQH